MKLLILPFILGWILSAILAFFYENWEDNRKQNIEMRLKNQPQLALSKKQTWQNTQLNVQCVAYRTKHRVDYHPKIQLNHVSELKAAGFIQCLDAQQFVYAVHFAQTEHFAGKNRLLNAKMIDNSGKTSQFIQPEWTWAEKVDLIFQQEYAELGWVKVWVAMKFPLWGILFLHALVALWHMIHVLNYWINQFKTISKQGKESLK